MRQAIVVKFLAPTNKRGPRLVAKADAGRLVVAWDHKLGVEENHLMAALDLCRKLGWPLGLRGGTLPDSGYVYLVG